MVDAFRASAPFRVEHCWQPDAGFRLAGARNLGARAATSDRFVFLDGDCVPFPDLVARHVEAADPAAFSVGERYLLEEDEALAVTEATIASGAAFKGAPAREVRRVRRIARNDVLYRLTGLKPDRPRLLGSNFSVPRAPFEAVNGLDERHVGWGHEDEDLRRRLVARGFRPASLVGEANCLHLWHLVLNKDRKRSPNWRYLQRGFFLSRCRRGLVERPLADLAASVVAGDATLAERARRALGLGAPAPAGARLELEVLLDLELSRPAPRSSRRAEVTVLISNSPPDALPARAAGVDLVLAPGLDACGGELPGEVWPGVTPALARAGVKATRALPASPASLASDEGALAAARAVLDAIL